MGYVPRAAFSQHHGLSCYSQRPSAKHRISGVECEVHQHLFKLPGICPDVKLLIRRRKLEGNLGTQHSDQKLGNPVYECIEVKNSRLENLTSAKRQKLARQSGSFPRQVTDLQNILAGRSL